MTTPERLPRPDPERLLGAIDRMATVRSPSEPGATRPVFSAEYATGRELVAEMMSQAGLEPELDGAGNLVGRRPGREPALITGSHTDTVRGGGRLDGVLGVIGAIEAVRAISEAEIRLEHELRVVDFLGEEPNDWGISCIGSRALAGELGPHELGCRSADGTSLADALRGFGIDPDQVRTSRWTPGEVLAFVELHIEQGPVLEQSGSPIGVVSGVVGVERFVVEFEGRRDHAGTMPMALRHDAAAAAAELVLGVEKAVAGAEGVGTCGRIEVGPGALNVVPDRARVGVELRSIDPEWISSRRERVETGAMEAGRKRGVAVAISDLSSEGPTAMDRGVQQTISHAADLLGLRSQTLPSGAEHDARRLAGLGPAGMIFVPSVDGRSHCPEEHTDPEHLVAGVAALATTLVLLDRGGVGADPSRIRPA